MIDDELEPRQHSRGRRVWSVAIFAFALLAAMLFLTLLPEPFARNDSGDYATFYEPVARHLLEGRGLVGTDGRPAVEYPPGFPVCLSAVFGASRLAGVPEQVALRLFIVIATALTSILIFAIARSLWGPAPALVAAALWATYPPLLWLCKQPSSETPYTLVLYAGLALFWRLVRTDAVGRMGYLVAGALMGVATLIRPMAVGMPVVLASFLLCAHRPQQSMRTRLALGALVVLGSLSVILPWGLWVYFKIGRFQPLGTRQAIDVVDGLTFTVTPRIDRLPIRLPEELTNVERAILDRKDDLHSLSEVAAVLFQQFGERPAAVVKLILIKILRSWYATDSHRLEGFAATTQIVYLSLIGWAGWRAWQRGGHSKSFALLALLATLYSWAVTVAALSIVRYMVPICGLLFALTPAALPAAGEGSTRVAAPGRRP